MAEREREKAQDGRIGVRYKSQQLTELVGGVIYVEALCATVMVQSG